MVGNIYESSNANFWFFRENNAFIKNLNTFNEQVQQEKKDSDDNHDIRSNTSHSIKSMKDVLIINKSFLYLILLFRI